jgi:exonuclease III
MQQYRAIQVEYLQNNKLGIKLDPHCQLILDLQSWICHLQQDDHRIILNMDNNDDFYYTEGSFYHLNYCANSLTHCNSHDGTLRSLAISCGLIDILSIQHSEHPFPPTYNRGKKRIDYMLISASLQDAVVRSGILPYNSIFLGDHRPCFLDLMLTASLLALPHH